MAHIDDDDMFVALSTPGLPLGGCLAPTTEVDDSSTLGNLIIFEWWQMSVLKG